MARTQNTLIGRASGSINTNTFTKWKSINVVKQKPTIVANPQTPIQQAQRNRFSVASLLGFNAQSVFNQSFPRQRAKMSGQNAFVSRNLINGAVYTSSDSTYIDFPKVEVSLGNLHTPLSASQDGPIVDNSIHFIWSTEASGRTYEQDKIVVIAAAEVSTDVWQLFAPNNYFLRNSGGGTFNYDVYVADMNIYYYYLFAYNSQHQVASQTLFFEPS